VRASCLDDVLGGQCNRELDAALASLTPSDADEQFAGVAPAAPVTHIFKFWEKCFYVWCLLSDEMGKARRCSHA
jgi:hypothetical protein